MSDERPSRVGTQFGPYLLKRLIGRGGMGEVYEAEDTVRDRTVALKLLPESVSDDPVFRKRLRREAHSAGRLQEPHVVPIHDYGEIDGLMYVDMRLIDGTDLRAILTREGPMTPARAVAITSQIASALDAAHESGVNHRDVKPENILITGNDFAYLVDFGIANAKATDEKLTQLGTAVGTYAYMAPERFSNAEVTHKADIYALACVLHECLTGSQPYPNESVSVMITSHLMQPIPRPSTMRPGIPAAFDQVVARGMAKDPNDRFASAGDFAKAATEALTSQEKNQAADILARSAAATQLGPQVVLPPYTSHPSVPRAQHSTTPPTFAGATTPMPPQTSGPRPMYGGSFQPPGTPTAGQSWGPSGPTGPTPPKKSKKWIPFAVAGGIVAVILAVVGIFVIIKPGSSDVADDGPTSTTETTTERTRTSETTAENDAYTRLLRMLPSGFSSSNCEVADDQLPDTLTTISCTTNAETPDVEFALFALYPDLVTLNRNYHELIMLDSPLEQCPGTGTESPMTWNYDKSPDTIEGQVACGIYESNPAVTWTNNARLFLGDARGSDMTKLHDWWLQYG